MEESTKFLVPVFVVCYADSADEAVECVESALDSSEFIFSDGIFSAEVIDSDVEEFEEDF